MRVRAGYQVVNGPRHHHQSHGDTEANICALICDKRVVWMGDVCSLRWASVVEVPGAPPRMDMLQIGEESIVWGFGK